MPVEAIAFIGLHFLALLGFVAVCFGLGAPLLRRYHGTGEGLRIGLTLSVGLGIVILLLQVAAAVGQLNRPVVLLLALVGGLLAVWQRPVAPYRWPPVTTPRPWGERVALFLLAAAAARTLFAPFRPVKGWDEVMYHLPHAAQWAESGALTINEWLRYPWFPYNYDLLYALSLLLYDEVFAHLLHALAGWLTAWLIYSAGRLAASRTQGALAATFWLLLTGSSFRSAYVDLGVTLFVFSAFLALWWRWRAYRSDPWLVWLAALLLGVAVGSKYQALGFVPLLWGGLILVERRLSVLGGALIALLLPSLYWYARNALLTGDPFNPIGGAWFGYTDWNAGDFQLQLEDLRSRAQWPDPMLWPALLVPLLRRSWSDPTWRVAMGVGLYGLAIWYLSSGGYERYLMTSYPVLALLSAHAIALLAQGAATRWGWCPGGGWSGVGGRVGRWAAVLLFAALTLPQAWGDLRRMAVTAEQREAFALAHIAGYDVLRELPRLNHRGIYQFGLEDSIYYAPQPIWGDCFGSARYRDFAALSAAALAERLRAMGIDLLLVHHGRWPGIAQKPEFGRYFAEILQGREVSAYRLVEAQGGGV